MIAGSATTNLEAIGPKANRAASNAATKKYREKYPEFGLWASAKYRAKKRGTPFSISRKDVVIPEFCPVLGIKLQKGSKHGLDDSPSIDCLIPEKGYVPGNIAVISYRANTIKSNASAAELRAVTDWLEKSLPSQTPNSIS